MSADEPTALNIYLRALEETTPDAAISGGKD